MLINKRKRDIKMLLDRIAVILTIHTNIEDYWLHSEACIYHGQIGNKGLQVTANTGGNNGYDMNKL
jgi:hypothetical protein